MIKQSVLMLCVFSALSCVGNVVAHSAHEFEQEKVNMTFSGKITDGEEVLFRLSIPYGSMFRDEKPWLVYGIRNAGEDDVILTNNVIGKMSIGDVRDAQMWFQFGKGGQSKWDLHPAIGRNWSRMTSNREDVQPLKRGDIVVASSRDGSFFSNSSALGYEKVRGALLVGENHYVASNWCDIKISPKSLMEGAVFMEIDYGSPAYKAPVFINELDGERWIFIQNYRIAKVPDDAQPVFDIAKETSIVTIRFTGGDYEPVVHDVKMIRTLSGPRELVPHLHLQKEMMAMLGAEDHPTVFTGGGRNAETGTSELETSDQRSANHPRWVLPSAIGAILLVVIGILVSRFHWGSSD